MKKAFLEEMAFNGKLIDMVLYFLPQDTINNIKSITSSVGEIGGTNVNISIEFKSGFKSEDIFRCDKWQRCVYDKLEGLERILPIVICCHSKGINIYRKK